MLCIKKYYEQQQQEEHKKWLCSSYKEDRENNTYQQYSNLFEIVSIVYSNEMLGHDVFIPVFVNKDTLNEHNHNYTYTQTSIQNIQCKLDHSTKNWSKMSSHI